MGPTISDPVAPNTSLNRPSAQAVSLSPSGHLHGSLSQARLQRLTVVPTLLHPSPSSPFCAGPSPLRTSFSTSLHHTGPDSGPVDTPMSGGVRPHMASRASSGQTRATHTQAGHSPPFFPDSSTPASPEVQPSPESQHCLPARPTLQPICLPVPHPALPAGFPARRRPTNRVSGSLQKCPPWPPPAQPWGMSVTGAGVCVKRNFIGDRGFR